MARSRRQQAAAGRAVKNGSISPTQRVHGPGIEFSTLAAISVIFVLGLCVRYQSLNLPSYAGTKLLSSETRWRPAALGTNMEHDEQIYVALVQQLDAGKGYTLQGHRVLDEPWIVREQYDRPVFFHPPGGIAFFWLMHRLAGDAGYAWAQLLSYTIFFVGLVIIGWTIIPALDSLAVLALAILAAFSPIMANVTGRFWLDGPLLAFSTAAAACFLLGLRRDRTGLAAVGALLLGFASLIKLTAFLIVPGVLALAVVTSH